MICLHYFMSAVECLRFGFGLGYRGSVICDGIMSDRSQQGSSAKKVVYMSGYNEYGYQQSRATDTVPFARALSGLLFEASQSAMRGLCRD
jgi:hypothetical protein